MVVLPIEQIVRRVRTFPDFPRAGVVFQDLAPLYAEPGLLGRLGEQLAGKFGTGFDAVLGVEARGFVVAASVAVATGSPLVLARKEGKLPGLVHTTRYDLEYGSAALVMQRNEFAPDARVLIVDDVLATGGTLQAAADLVTEAGAAVAGFGVLVELVALGGRARLEPHRLVSIVAMP